MEKTRYCGESGLGGAGAVFTTDLDGFSLQYSRFMSSWSCFVGPRDLIISLPPHFYVALQSWVCVLSSLQILAKFCCPFFYLIFSPCLSSLFLSSKKKNV